MAFRTLLGLLAALVISFSAWAEEVQLNPSHPDQYTVVKGDTLWEISGKFLTHAWQWPELWKQNDQIQNPHLIYPGDTIYLSIVNGKPQLSLSHNDQPAFSSDSGPCVLREEDYVNGRKDFAVSADGKVLPCIRETSIKEAIRMIPTNAIAQFLSSPKVVSENELNTAPYVVDFAGEHLIAGNGDRLYVRSITDPQSMSYTIYRAGDTYTNPETGEILGYEAAYIADTSLQQAGDPATLIINKSTKEIRIGDRVMPTSEDEVTLNYFPRPPKESIKANIISVLGGVSQIGEHNIVVIDKGRQDGLLVGHELDIYQLGKTVRDSNSATANDMVKLPDEIAGKLMVFRPFERVSYALVMKATRAIHVLDKAQTP